MIKIKKEIAVGIFLVLVLAIVLALGFETIDRPSVSTNADVYSPNETKDEEATDECKLVRQPENQQLHRKMIDGWEIIVAQSPMPADKDKSREIAKNYLLNSPTFRFDGIEDSLKLVVTNTLKCPCCWEFVFEFQCRHSGYGNRT
ncbi:hypothetical protein CW714_01660, partial [Methanophagales archaeon]